MTKIWKSLCGALAVVMTMNASADALGITGSHIAINAGSAEVWYRGEQPDGKSNMLGAFDPRWDDVPSTRNLGSFALGSTAFISGAEVLTFDDALVQAGGAGRLTGAFVHWCVDSCSTGFASSALGLIATANTSTPTTFFDQAGNLYEEDGEQQWSGLVAPIDFLANVGVGDHSLFVYFSATYVGAGTTAEGTDYSRGLNDENFMVTFQVTDANSVPEPSALALAGLSLALLAATRRRKH